MTRKRTENREHSISSVRFSKSDESSGDKMELRDITSFPDDLTSEILLRLPLKTIFKIKCVSKAWNNFISQPTFEKQYRDSSRQSKRSSCLFFYASLYPKDHVLRHKYMDGPVNFISISSDKENLIEDKHFDFINNLGYVLASSNGLLLLERNPGIYYVCDPFTKKHVKLPQSNRRNLDVAIGFTCQINDREDGLSIHYKLVCVSRTINTVNKTRDIETYSSETGEWKESQVSASSEFHFNDSMASVIKGVFYWSNKNITSMYVYDPNNIEGCTKLIEIPSVRTHRYCSAFFEAIDGKVCFILFDPDMKVWVFDDEKSDGDTYSLGKTCWTLIDTISFTSLGFTNKVGLVGVCTNLVRVYTNLVVFYLDGDIIVVDWLTKSRVKTATFDLEKFPCGFNHYEQPIWPLFSQSQS